MSLLKYKRPSLKDKIEAQEESKVEKKEVKKVVKKQK